MLDLLTLPTALGLMTFLVFYWWSRIPKDDPTRPYLVPAFALSVFAGLAFASIYNYYYVGGDTFWYYQYGQFFRVAFEDNFLIGIRLFLAPVGSDAPEFYEYTTPIWHLYHAREDTESISMAKIIGLVEAISVPSYWLTTVIFSFFAFSGKWKLYRLLATRYPRANKPLAYGILFVPSVLFWGSGIIKDTVCLGALCWCTYHFFKLVESPLRSAWRIAPILIFAKAILLLKAYIILAAIPSAGLYIYNNHKPSSTIGLIKYVTAPIFVAMILVGASLTINSIAQSSSKYQLNELEKRAEGFRTYHGYLGEAEGQSSYNLGEVEYTPAGVLRKAPAAINVTYFRPYLWEVNEPLQYLSALESIIILFFVLMVLWRVGLSGFWQALKRDNLAQFSFLYAILFGTSVGLTAYNFGALVRFKIPGVIFLLVFVAVLSTIKTGKEQASLPAEETAD